MLLSLGQTLFVSKLFHPHFFSHFSISITCMEWFSISEEHKQFEKGGIECIFIMPHQMVPWHSEVWLWKWIIVQNPAKHFQECAALMLTLNSLKSQHELHLNHCRVITCMEVNGYCQLFGYQHSSKYLFFVYHRRRKCIQVWNNSALSKWWQNFHFWVNYPFTVDTVKIHYCRNLPQISGNIYWSFICGH